MSEFNKYSTDGGATFIDVEDSNAVHWGDQSKGYVGKNNVYRLIEGYALFGAGDGHEGFWISSATNGCVAIAKVENNKDYIFTKATGNRCRVVGFINEPVIDGTHDTDLTHNAQLAAGSSDTQKTLNFNSGNFNYVVCACNSGDAYNVSMDAMVRLNTILDNSYEPYIPPNTEIIDKMTYTDNTILGAKNLLYPTRYKGIIMSNNGVDLTLNDDYTVSATGVSTATALTKYSVIKPPAGTYVVSKQPNNETANNIKVQFNACNGDSETYIRNLANLYTNKSKIITIDYADYDRIVVYLVVEGANVDVDGAKIYPMMCYSNYPNNTVYEEPAMTNKALSNSSFNRNITLNSVNDLNNITEPGIYSILDTQPINSPVTNATLIVNHRTGNDVNQIILRYDKIYTRAYGGGNWTNWFVFNGTQVTSS